MGRHSSFKEEYIGQAEKLCALGATDVELADFFGIDISTLYRWKNEFEGFCEAIKTAKEAADNRVERSLYARATGYTFDTEKVVGGKDGAEVVPYREHVPPDTTAMIFWLKNRMPKQWRDRRIEEISGLDGGPLTIVTGVRRPADDKPFDD